MKKTAVFLTATKVLNILTWNLLSLSSCRCLCSIQIPLLLVPNELNLLDFNINCHKQPKSIPIENTIGFLKES